MKLVIGGCAQGKLTYALERYGLQVCKIWNGELPRETGNVEETVLVNHLHRWVRDRLEAGGDPEGEIGAFVDQFPDCVILCDEIGNGIVPVEAFEREYRERTGRILIMLAKEAEEVVRVVCGIGQKIK